MDLKSTSFDFAQDERKRVRFQHTTKGPPRHPATALPFSSETNVLGLLARDVVLAVGDVLGGVLDRVAGVPTQGPGREVEAKRSRRLNLEFVTLHDSGRVAGRASCAGAGRLGVDRASPRRRQVD